VLAASWLALGRPASAGLALRRARHGATPSCDEDCELRARDAVERIRQYAWQLVLESRENISMAGKSTEWRLNSTLRERSREEQRSLQRASRQQREQALAHEREWLAAQTAHNESLRPAAEYEMLSSAYAAMGKEFSRDQGLWQQLAHNATGLRQEYGAAVQDWSAALGEGSLASQAGELLLRNATAALHRDMRWLKDAVDTVDLMGKAVPQPFQDVNWTRHAVRLASDLSALGYQRGREAEAQVQRAESQAQRAQVATRTNAERLDKLEEMVAEAEGQALALAR